MGIRIALSVLFLGFAASKVSFSEDAPHPSVLHVREFVENPSLTAHARQTVLLDMQFDDLAEPAIRYELEAGKHDFCLKGDDPYFTGMILEDAAGKTVFTMPSDRLCITATLPEGIYRLRTKHLSELQPDPTRLTHARVQVDIPGPPLLDTNGYALGGFWAISPYRDLSSSIPGAPGTFGAKYPPRDLGGNYSNAMPLFTNAGWGFSGYDLISFPANQHPLALEPGFFLDVIQETGDPTEMFTMIEGNYTCNAQPCDLFGANSSFPAKTLINDLGGYQFTFSWPNPIVTLQFSLQQTNFSSETLSALNGAPPTTMNVWFRFYPDGTQVGSLNEGEIAVFGRTESYGVTCNYQGSAAIFGQIAASLPLPLGEGTNMGFSYKLGNNTAVLIQLNFIQKWIVTDTPCLDSSLLPLVGIEDIEPLDEFLQQSEAVTDCPMCKLVGAHLSGFKFPGVNWRGADMSRATLTDVWLNGSNLTGAKFIGATLTNTNLHAATLTGGEFTGAKLSCVDLSGTDSQHLEDLTVLLTSDQLVPSTSCLSNLAYTKLSTAILPPKYWRYADLTGAVFVDLQPGMQLSTQANPLDLTGAILAGVSLEQVGLDYAVLAGANLTQTLFNKASLQHVNLGGAKLYGAQLNNTNLDGANLSGAYLSKSPSGDVPAANLEGAFLRNVNLSQAQLTGADFTNASFYSTAAVGTGACTWNDTHPTCATAVRAVVNNTVFSGAYLFGVDFSDAQIQAAHFANAVLVGANFNGATISADSTIGSDSGFPGAFLQGTNLQPAQLVGNVSLASAYVDFSTPSNTIYLVLGEAHTDFPGYWNPPGAVCAEMFYSGPTTVPATNSTTTCPNGLSNTNGCGPASADGSNPYWNSQGDSIFYTGSGQPTQGQVASYQFPATYTNSPASGNPICVYDPLWISSGVSRRRGPRPHPRQPKSSQDIPISSMQIPAR